MSDEHSQQQEFLKEATRFWRIYLNVMDMVKERHFEPQYRADVDLNGFLNTYCSGGAINRASAGFDATRNQGLTREDRLFVVFMDSSTVGVQPIKTIIEKMIAGDISRVIIVTQKKLTPSAYKIIAQSSPKYIGEVFEEKELQINITKHQLVPKHVVLSSDEKKILLERYHLKDTQLPRIQQTDPIARYYGLRRGEVVKIIRASETAGRYLTYRLCL